MSKPTVLILGKLPPPYMGPAIATSIILNSSLKDRFRLLHLDTKANESLQTLGKWSLGKLLRNLGIYFRMFRILITRRPSLVLIPISQTTTGYLKDVIFIVLAKITFRKVIVQLRGSDFQNWLQKSSPLTRWFVRFTLGRTQGVIVLGNKLKSLFQSIFPEEKIFVVPNGGNYPLKYAEKNNEKVRVLYLANLQASKGIEDVLQAIALLPVAIKEQIQVDVVGNWRKEETRKNCISIVTEEKLPVTFYPPDAGQFKFDMLSGSDIFVFTPRAPEGHPWVIVEAMAAGLPIISTDQGAIVESVLDGQNGYIVERQNPAAIALRLEKLIKDRSLREQMSRQSRKLYEEKFTEEAMVNNLTKTFHAVMAGN